MSCPACGCKVTYQYDDPDDYGNDYAIERCSACGDIFDVEDGAGDDDEQAAIEPCPKCGCESEGAPGLCYACMTPLTMTK